MNRTLVAIASAAVLLAAGGAHATAYQGTSGVAAKTTVDFTNDGLLQNAPIGALYPGLSFSGAFQNYFDPIYPNGDAQYAANYSTAGEKSGDAFPADSIAIQFATPVTDATFSINSDVSGVGIYSFLNGALVDSIVTNTNFIQSNNYYGFVNSNFNYILIDPAGAYNDLDIDNLSYTPQITAVPEPSSWALIISGAGMLGGALRFGRRRGLIATA